MYELSILIWSTAILRALGGHILVMPYDVGYNSRLMDFTHLTKMLLDHGHTVSLLINDYDKQYFEDIKGLEHVYEYPAPKDLKTFTKTEFRKLGLLPGLDGLKAQMDALINLHRSYCTSLLKQSEILNQLKDVQFDLIFIDFAYQCGRIIVYELGLPTASYNSHGFHADKVFFPNLPSFIPSVNVQLGYTDHMTFRQRIINSVNTMIGMYLNPFIQDTDALAEEFHFKIPSSTHNAFNKNAIVFAVCDPALDYPRPLFPNVRCIGGLNNKPAKPLDSDLENFMQSAGKDGVLVVSFGSVLSRFESNDQALTIAKALSKLPMKVIWRYQGNPPSYVGENTRIEQWLPQNDLLGHPQTKAFVTHCGSHGMFETAYHGVPVIAVPVYIDQFSNAKRLVDHAKMGVEVDFETMTEEDLYNAIMSVVNNVTFKENAMLTSALLNDRPISAKEEFLFYIDYSIRNKGSGRMQSEVLNELSLFYIYSVDVILVLGLIFITILFIFVLCLCRLVKCVCKSVFKMKKD